MLRQAGISVDLFDLDLEGVLSLLRPDRLVEAGAIIRQRAQSAGADERYFLERSASRAPALAESIAAALATIRNPEQFFEPTQLNCARERIYDSLDIVSLAAGRPLSYQTEVLRYEVKGIDPSRFCDLLEVTNDPAANLFEEHWIDTVYPALENAAYDLVGISLTLRWQIIPGLSLARRLRQKGFRVVLGGTAIAKVSHRLPHLPEFFTAFADAVVTREGETALLELVNQLQGEGNFAMVPNLLYKADGRVCATKLHIEDYAALPTPDFDGMPLGRYLSPSLVLPVMIGKGCYHDECTFCDIPFINRVSPKRYRARSAETVAADITKLAEKHGCRHFLLADEALPPRLLEKVADALVQRKHRELALSGYARLEPGFTPPLCEKLAAAGLRRIYFGLESADQATLDRMQKGIRIENTVKVLRNCHAAGIGFHVFSMIGFPGEDANSAERTIEFFEDNADLFDSPANTFDIHELEILTDTAYFSQAEKFGIRILAPVAGKDFVFGIGTDWENTIGLSRAQIALLLQEAVQRITPRFSRYHAWPPIAWPAQEEWALIYADRYCNQPVPHLTFIPQEPSALPYRIAWNPAAHVEQKQDKVVVTSRRGSLELDLGSFRLLGENSSYRPASEIVGRLAGGEASDDHRAEVTKFVNQLIRQRLLEFVREPPTTNVDQHEAVS